MQKPFKDALQDSVLVFDGAMGTEIYRNHVFTNQCYDSLNLTQPKLIQRILTCYLEAGADILTTNTFGANRLNLGKYGLAEKLVDINREGAISARKVANQQTERDIYVAGSIGPYPVSVSDRFRDEKIIELIQEQIAALKDGGVDVIFFESQHSRRLVLLEAQAMAAFPEMPFIFSYALSGWKKTCSGETIHELFAPIPDTLPQPVAVGLNCGLGPDEILEPLEEALKLVDCPFIVEPNAGIPREFEGRQLYYCSPEYIATYAMRYIALGVAAVGGCCGTTPEHIAEIVKMVKPLAKGRREVPVFQYHETDAPEQEESPFAERSRLAWKLAHRKWVTTVEITPPRGYDLTEIITKSQKLARHGIDAINLPDGPRASSRISSLVVADRILHEAGIEPILHFCCRDRNLIGMQADLLACAARDIRNILFITGDPPKLGNYPNATGVFDTDSVGMCQIQRKLNHGVDLGGQSLSPATNAVFGVGLDPTAIDRKREIERFHRKIDAGAHFAITQPVFDSDCLLEFLDDIGNCPIPIIAGVWPLASLKNAIFMQNEVPGVVIPDTTMKRMEEAATESREKQLAVGIRIAREMIERIRSVVAGVQISAPFGRIDIVLDVLNLQ